MYQQKLMIKYITVHENKTPIRLFYYKDDNYVEHPVSLFYVEDGLRESFHNVLNSYEDQLQKYIYL